MPYKGSEQGLRHQKEICCKQHESQLRELNSVVSLCALVPRWHRPVLSATKLWLASCSLAWKGRLDSSPPVSPLTTTYTILIQSAHTAVESFSFLLNLYNCKLRSFTATVHTHLTHSWCSLEGERNSLKELIILY